MSLDGQGIAESLKGKTNQGNEVLHDEVAEHFGGPGADSADSGSFDWRNALSREDIDENAVRQMYASMSDEDLLAQVDAMKSNFSAVSAFAKSTEKKIAKMTA